jgi:nucleoside-diphosphate-sugar epimerase
MKKVLVTGANGFLGRRLVEQLLERGHAVRAFVLPGEAVPAQWSGRVEILRGDMTAPQAIADAAAGMDAICHLAALVGDGHSKAAQARITVGGTRNVVEAARRHRCHVILASSICAYGDHIQRGACPEDRPYGRAQGSYGWAKQKRGDGAGPGPVDHRPPGQHLRPGLQALAGRSRRGPAPGPAGDHRRRSR